MNEGVLQGRVAVVTGAAAGLGQAEALALAAAGADVVLTDISAAVSDTAEQVRALGVQAAVVTGDIADSAVAAEVISAAVQDLGGLHVVVNNAGFVRDRMLFGMSDDEWDSVVRVHLRGHFVVTRAAASYWRGESKRTGEPVYGRLINTASEAWLFGAPGQANYAAAKAGIAALTVSVARGMGRYGVRANVICPRARTAMTQAVFGEAPEGAVDPLSVDQVAPFVAYLGSPAAQAINGQVFVVHSGSVMHLAPPTVAARFRTAGQAWTVAELEQELGPYFAQQDPEAVFACRDLPREG